MYLPYFGQDLELKKKVIGILAHVCPLASFDTYQTFNPAVVKIRPVTVKYTIDDYPFNTLFECWYYLPAG